MPNARRINLVHRSLSRPLTILGAERKLFFFAMCIGAGTFNLLGSLAGGTPDVLVALFLRALGHKDRSADFEARAHSRQDSKLNTTRPSSRPSRSAG